MRHSIFAAVILFVSFAAPPAGAEPSSGKALLRRYLDAFNRHDVAATVACVDTAFRWYNVGGDTLRLAMQGREGQRAGLARYFGAFSDVKSEMDGMVSNGPWVMVREQLRWTGSKGPAENIALAAYEIRSGLIFRVYYFPAERRVIETGQSR